MFSISTTGDRIRGLRKKIGLTQEALAAQIGVSRMTVISWEKGKFEPGRDNTKDLALVLGTTSSFLMGESKDPSPEPQKPLPSTCILRAMREQTGLSLDEAATLINLSAESLDRVETYEDEADNALKGKLLQAYGKYLAGKDGETQGMEPKPEKKRPEMVPIQGGGACAEESNELVRAVETLAKNSLIRKSVRMMEDLTEEERQKVFQYIQDQELVARVKGKKEA